MNRCTSYHVQTSNPRRFLLLKTLYEKVSGTENSIVHVEVGASDAAPVIHSTYALGGSAYGLPRSLVCA